MICSVPSTPCRRLPRIQVLPLKQKSLKLCGSDRLDFAAQLAQRQAMNPRQDAPVAPFGFALRKIGREAAAHHLPFRFQLQERGFDFIQAETRVFRPTMQPSPARAIPSIRAPWQHIADQMQPFRRNPKALARLVRLRWRGP